MYMKSIKKKLISFVFVWLLMASMFVGFVPAVGWEIGPIDAYIKSDYAGSYDTGLRIDNTAEEPLPLDESLTVGETYFIKYNAGYWGVGEEYGMPVDITVIVDNGSWNSEIANYSILIFW